MFFYFLTIIAPFVMADSSNSSSSVIVEEDPSIVEITVIERKDYCKASSSSLATCVPVEHVDKSGKFEKTITLSDGDEEEEEDDDDFGKAISDSESARTSEIASIRGPDDENVVDDDPIDYEERPVNFEECSLDWHLDGILTQQQQQQPGSSGLQQLANHGSPTESCGPGDEEKLSEHSPMKSPGDTSNHDDPQAILNFQSELEREPEFPPSPIDYWDDNDDFLYQAVPQEEARFTGIMDTDSNTNTNTNDLRSESENNLDESPRRKSPHSLNDNDSNNDKVAKKKRTRRTPEEISAAKEEKEKLRQVREEQRNERQKERELREKLKKNQQERSKALRQAAAAQNLANCHKSCKTFVCSKILERFCTRSELLAVFEERGAPIFFIDECSLEFGVRWKRELRRVNEATDSSHDELSPVKVTHEDVNEENILLVLGTDKYVPMVFESRKKISDQEVNGETLHDFVASVLTKYDKNLTIVFFGFEKYLQQQKRVQNREFLEQQGLGSGRNVQRGDLPSIKRNDLDWVILDVLFSRNSWSSNKKVHFMSAESGSELCAILWAQTRAIATAPQKKVQREQHGLDWYAQNDAYGAVDINSEEDITPLWTKQLATFPKVSLDLAKTIAHNYPTPLNLLSAYRQCATACEKDELLADIEVSRNNFTRGNTVRRIGPQISKRIHLLMTSNQPDILLDN
ncbi:methyl methanesulfonate sensitivity 4 [Brevipalpus obovatus]|uniref:methyl methanesulfonate sensitivity 4 n=1 Tax=Brevipalpus obovatus TaxID=246614 RepID=UPI003D9F5F6E